MKIYLVGGAVRDLLLGESINEYDWVVVGATATQMLEMGYQQVGKDFPVFLHPYSKEEYALARTERKSSHGYKGFTVFANSSVTLVDDLLRRDLTINALALDVEQLCGHHIEHHQHKNPLQYLLSKQHKASLNTFSNTEIIDAIVDPFNGLNDLSERKLKHISSAFAEDPLRVIRLARFSARFFHLGFSIVEETEHLAKNMSDSGELDYLVAERVWQETERAFMTQTPSQYFEFLYAVRALEKIYPELAAVIKEHVQKNKYSKSSELCFTPLNPPFARQTFRGETKVTPSNFHLNNIELNISSLDIDSADNGGLKNPDTDYFGIENPYPLNSSTIANISIAQRFAGLNRLAQQTDSNRAKFALFFSVLFTSKLNNLQRQKADFYYLCQRWKIPNSYRDLTCSIGPHVESWLNLQSIDAESLLNLLSDLNAFKQDETLELFCAICDSIFYSETGYIKNQKQTDWLIQAVKIVRQITAQQLIAEGKIGAEIKNALADARKKALELYLVSNDL